MENPRRTPGSSDPCTYSGEQSRGMWELDLLPSACGYITHAPLRCVDALFFSPIFLDTVVYFNLVY
jgi:hypothetical protein